MSGRQPASTSGACAKQEERHNQHRCRDPGACQHPGGGTVSTPKHRKIPSTDQRSDRTTWSFPVHHARLLPVTSRSPSVAVAVHRTPPSSRCDSTGDAILSGGARPLGAGSRSRLCLSLVSLPPARPAACAAQPGAARSRRGHRWSRPRRAPPHGQPASSPGQHHRSVLVWPPVSHPVSSPPALSVEAILGGPELARYPKLLGIWRRPTGVGQAWLSPGKPPGALGMADQGSAGVAAEALVDMLGRRENPPE